MKRGECIHCGHTWSELEPDTCPKCKGSGAAPCSPSGIEALVCADISGRQQIGIKKYGVTVEENPLTLREWLVHSYQEKLDDIIYMRRAIAELDKENAQAES